MTDLELLGGGMKVRKTTPEEIREEQKVTEERSGGGICGRGGRSGDRASSYLG